MLVFIFIFVPKMKGHILTRRETILDIAAKLFREKGYTATSVRELADNVGIEAASLYNHFASKEEILKEICFETGKEYLRHLSEVNRFAGDYRQKISRFIQLHIEITIKHIAFVAVANHEWRHLKSENLTGFLSMRKQYEIGVLHILKNGMNEGAFREINPEIALFTLLSALRWVEAWYKEDRNISVAALEKNIELLVLNGLNT